MPIHLLNAGGGPELGKDGPNTRSPLFVFIVRLTLPRFTLDQSTIYRYELHFDLRLSRGTSRVLSFPMATSNRQSSNLSLSEPCSHRTVDVDSVLLLPYRVLCQDIIYRGTCYYMHGNKYRTTLL